jgi:ubiquitin thioesterase ZRANB1
MVVDFIHYGIEHLVIACLTLCYKQLGVYLIEKGHLDLLFMIALVRGQHCEFKPVSFLALSDHETCRFHARWREWETLQASAMNYSVLDYQWQQDWDNLVTRASQPGRALEQMHVFVLAHIFRRPIIVYGVKYVKSFRGETLDLAKFQGIYLPLLWEHSFCYKSPIALGYTRGHFSALVCIDGGYSDNAAAEASNIESNYSSSQIHFLPLVDHEGSLLPVHFLTRSEVSCSLMS